MKILKHDDLIIATSIAPYNIENQRKVIDSWISAGFVVVSLNCKEEWEILAPYFEDIHFELVERDAREELGKPYVYISDFMNYFKGCQYSYCGIINSDNYLATVSNEFKEFIITELKDSIVFGSRMDVDTSSDSYGTVYDKGYDFFFFERKLADIYPDEGFCIGQPIWDYWMIFIPILCGIQVKKLMNPITYHIRHSLNWEHNNINKFMRKILFKKNAMELHQILNNIDLSIYAINFVNLINRKAIEIAYTSKENGLSVLLVYDGNEVPSEESETYRSIKAQTYRNIRMLECKRDEISVQDIEEELVCFIREGVVLNKFYIELMVNSIADSEYAVCGVKLINSEGTFVDNIYPIDFNSKALEKSRVIEECIMYRKEVLKGNSLNLLPGYRMGFTGKGLVEVKYNEYIIKRLEGIKRERLYIYAAGGHTRKLLTEIDFGSYNLCGIIDKNRELAGSELDGYRIYHIDDMDKLEIDWILISSISFEREIYDELSKSFDSRKLIRIYFN